MKVVRTQFTKITAQSKRKIKRRTEYRSSRFFLCPYSENTAYRIPFFDKIRAKLSVWLNFILSFSLFYGELITKILNLSANLQIKNRISLKIMLLNIHLLRKKHIQTKPTFLTFCYL